MAEVARNNPKDIEAQVFYALALIAVAPLRRITPMPTRKRAAALFLEHLSFAISPITPAPRIT